MAIFSHQRHHWAYVWIPLFGAFIWFGMLLSMIVTWAAQDTGRYPWMSSSSVPYISDIGSSFLRPLFIAGCSVTAVSFVLALAAERLLRHHGRLHSHLRRRERTFASLAIFGAVIGGAALVLLSIFDNKDHKKVHDGMLLVFIVGVALSAIFTIAEFRWISKSYVYVRELRHAYIMKGVIAGLLIILAIAYAITFSTADNVGGVLEWVIAFGFTLYLLTFAYDLRLSKGMHKHQLSAPPPEAAFVNGHGAPPPMAHVQKPARAVVV